MLKGKRAGNKAEPASSGAAATGRPQCDSAERIEQATRSPFSNQYVCRACGLELNQVGTNIFRHKVAMRPSHNPNFPPKTCGTKPQPMRVGDYIAMVNRKRIIAKPRRQPKRTIDIEQFSDTLLYFWVVKRSQGVSYRELGMAYGMNGLQMRSAIAQWKRKNVART